jgi:hypothetical protein
MIVRPHLATVVPSTVLLVALTCLATVNAQRKPLGQTNPATRGAFDAKEIARRVLPSVVLLECDNGGDRGSQGSGFLVRPGIVVTNYHVIEGMVRGIATGNGARRSWRISRVLDIDFDSDIALLQISGAEQAGVPVLSLATGGRIAPGETIYALGNPKGLMGTISPGIVSASLRSFKQGARIQISAPISHGSSGGPVVNSRAEVIGVAQGSIVGGQNLNFAVPAYFVSSLLRGIDSNRNTIYAKSSSVEGSWEERSDNDIPDFSFKQDRSSMDLGTVHLTLGMSKDKALADLGARYKVTNFPDSGYHIHSRDENRPVGLVRFTDDRLTYINRELTVAQDDAFVFGTTLHAALSEALGATEKVTEVPARITLFANERESITIKSININVQGHTITIVISDVGGGRRGIQIQDAISQ